MNELKIFKNAEFGQIRTVTINDEPWFVGKDVAQALGYGDENKKSKALTNAINRHVDEEDKGVTEMVTPGGTQNTTVINESGLYSLILSSKLPTAKKFKRWVTNDVLPSIRKHGVYAVDELLNDPDLAIKAFTALKEEKEKNKQLVEENERMQPKEIFADAVCASHTSILIGDLAKLIKQNGVDMGQKRLFEWLRQNGYLIKNKGNDWNMPTQRGMDLKLFEIKESTVNNPDGSVRINRTTKVTGKGQQYFINKFLGQAKDRRLLE